MWRYIVILILFSAQARAEIGDSSSFNTSSGNDNSTVESNNLTENNTYNGAGSSPNSQPVYTSNAPTVMGGGGNDSCLVPEANGIQLFTIGVSVGKMRQDESCNRRKDARIIGTPQNLGGMGLQVSGISIMCSSKNVFRAMALASTPCPLTDIKTGRILTGRKAYEMMRKNPDVYVVGYEESKTFWDAFLLMQLKEMELN